MSYQIEWSARREQLERLYGISKAVLDGVESLMVSAWREGRVEGEKGTTVNNIIKDIEQSREEYEAGKFKTLEEQERELLEASERSKRTMNPTFTAEVLGKRDGHPYDCVATLRCKNRDAEEKCYRVTFTCVDQATFLEGVAKAAKDFTTL